jgi:hypothetical protein
MKTPLTALALAFAILTGSLLAAGAEEAARFASLDSQVKARYCEKLREGALPYVMFVRRLKPIHGFTYDDFAPAYPGAPVKADCKAPASRIAEVREQVRLAEQAATQ